MWSVLKKGEQVKLGSIKFQRLVESIRPLLMASALVIGARVVGGGLGLVSQVVIARYLGAESLGLFFLSLSVATVLSIFASIGYPYIVTRFMVRDKSNGQAPELMRFISSARRDIRVASILTVVAGSAVVTLLPSISEETRICLILGVLTAPVIAILWFNNAIANGEKRFMMAYLPEIVVRPLLLLTGVAILWAASLPPNIIVLVAMNLVITVGLVVYQEIALPRVLSAAPGFTVAQKATVELRRRWRQHATPMIIATLFLSMFADFDLVLLGAILPHRELALFGVAIKIALFVAFAIQIGHQLILRDLAEAISYKDDAAIRRIITHANGIAIALSGSALGFVILFGDKVLGLFGHEFTGGYMCLVILMVAQFLRALAGPGTQVLTLTGHEAKSLPVFVGGLILLVVANIPLTLLFGLEGAALAVLIVTIGWTFGLTFVAYKRTGITTASMILPRAALERLNVLRR
jgi:O-antigen/teichoic acid export membrane protein